MIEQARCVCRAIRVDGVITPPPVIAKTSQLTYDAIVWVFGRGNIGLIEGMIPVGNRPPANANVLVETDTFAFEAYIVGGDLQPLIPEHRNAVRCPTGGG